MLFLHRQLCLAHKLSQVSEGGLIWLWTVFSDLKGFAVSQFLSSTQFKNVHLHCSIIQKDFETLRALTALYRKFPLGLWVDLRYSSIHHFNLFSVLCFKVRKTKYQVNNDNVHHSQNICLWLWSVKTRIYLLLPGIKDPKLKSIHVKI